MKPPASLSPQQAVFLSDPPLQAVMAAIEAAGGQVRVNGGAVRNALLGAAIGDVDLSTTLTPAHVTEILQRAAIKVVPTGFEHGTVTAVNGGKGFEVTTLREDVETDGRRAVVRFGTDWQADANRRDFTMNALYCDRKGTLYDPLGGYGDLVARRLRFIGDPDQRIAEDRLRILRFFRFFAWYGEGRPDADSLKACIRNKEGLHQLSAERVWHELRRLLGAPDPVKAMLWMRTGGVLEIVLAESQKWGTDLLPRLLETERAFNLPPHAMLRLMAIIPPRAQTALDISTRLKLSNEEAGRLAKWAASSLPSGSPGTGFDKQLYRLDRQSVLDGLWLERARLQGASVAADIAARQRIEALIAQAAGWQRPLFPLKGADLLDAGMSPGPALGKTLAALEAEWVDSAFMLSKADLLKRV